jgi:hypothetical protein
MEFVIDGYEDEMKEAGGGVCVYMHICMHAAVGWYVRCVCITSFFHSTAQHSTA